MPVYTLSTVNETALLSDGVKVIVAANNTGASVLTDIFNYLQNPTTGNQSGVALRYIEPSKAWILPDAKVVLFNVTTNNILFLEVSKQIRRYSKIKQTLKPLGIVWGFLATDQGIPIEVQPSEYIEIRPQTKRTCSTN